MPRLAAVGFGCFNTQPPEGGWDRYAVRCEWSNGFNTQPPEGGWVSPIWLHA